MRRTGAAAGRVRPLAAAAAALLLALAAGAPIWISRLVAPQYPRGLSIVAYGGRVSGDVAEINELNHYIGMRTISAEVAPELGLWNLLLLGLLGLALVGVFASGRLRRSAVALLWLAPLGVVLDIQRHLFVFGHDLAPDAALRVAPFTPLAIGPTRVWNFSIWAYPGPALLLLVAVAAIVTAVPRARLGVSRRLLARAAAALLVAPALVSAGAAPAAAGSGFDLAAAIAAAPPGAELRVPAGMYRGPLVLDRPITLVADGHVMIDGGGRGSVITVAAPDTTVRGVHVTGSGGQLEQGAGIAVRSDRVSVEHVTVSDSYNGVLARGAREVRIEDVRVTGRGEHWHGATVESAHHAPVGSTGDGISLWNVSGVVVRGSRLDRVRDGIYLSYVDDALLDSNTVTGSRYAVHAMYGTGLMVYGNRFDADASGIVIMYTGSAEAARNTITDQRGASGVGVLLKDTPRVRLVENVIARNAVGIRADGVGPGDESVVLRNAIVFNGTGVDLTPSAALAFTRNTFADNLVHLRIGAGNASTWMRSGAGNSWSGYRGYDLNGDGLGDVAHVEGTSSDRLLDRAPELEALRTSAAMSLLRQGERWWTLASRGTVTDRAPLIAPQAPTLEAPPIGTADAVAWTALGALLLAVASAALVLWRRAP